MKKIIFFMELDFAYRCGGIVVQYELAKNLNNSMVDVKIISPRNIKNNIYNDFLLTKTLDDVDNTIVVYGETIKGNPLNAKYVIRWILAPIGICSHIDNYKTWDPNDLVYYFNPEDKFIKEPEKVGKEYKLLNIIFINPNAINLNLPTRQGTCYTIRKAHEIHGKPKQPVHPPNSFEITRSHTQEDYVKIFNKYKYFISYDPLTFLSVIAALCGCISIVKKVDGLSKEDWLNMLAYTEYFKESGENTLYGIAYGADDLENAINTLHLVKKQWDDIKNFMINKNIKSFLDDMDNFDTLVNNVQNNFY
jgi:hypothetical protein